MAEDATPRPAAPAESGSSSEGTRKTWAEKFALPIALVALPIIYQGVAVYQADKTNAEADGRAKASAEAQQARDRQEQKFQLYTNLLSKREEADTAVRLGLFSKLIGTYLAPNTRDLGKKLVELELLAVNFNDALNLNPLFWELDREIERAPQAGRRKALRDQLDRVAKQVKVRQAALLEVDGFRRSFSVVLNCTEDIPVSQSWTFPAVQRDEAGMPDPKTEREFTLDVIGHDVKGRALSVLVKSPGVDQGFQFSVDPYDFPLANFSRITRSERFAVLIDTYDCANGNANLVFLYFPSTRSGAKDKPYIDDLMNKLLPQQGGVTVSAAPGTDVAKTPGK